MRAVIFSDLHLKSGGHLGGVDTEYENTRLRDSVRILDEIVSDPHDVLLFLGDMGRTAAPRPVAYRVLQRAMSKSTAPTVFVLGNHDWSGHRSNTGLHVVAEGLHTAKVCTQPVVVHAGELQIGVLPWTPPTRLFDAARHDPKQMHALVSERLVGVAHQLARKLDSSRPSILIGHWLLGGGKLASGSDVMEAAEPVVPVDDLEIDGWDVILMGHNHQHQALGQRSYHVGPPMRTGFGESDAETGYMTVEWAPSATVSFVPTKDRRLIRMNIEGMLTFLEPQQDCTDAIVRIRITCAEEDARVYNANGQELLRRLVERVKAAGAFKVIGPQLDVQRTRRVRSDLTVDTDPGAALDAWLTAQAIHDPLRARVLRAAEEIMR